MSTLALMVMALLAPGMEPGIEPGGNGVGDFYDPRSEAYPTIFFAVLEGAYRDGLSSEDLEVILTRRQGRPYEHFIYGCPLCTPTVAALEAYRNRPPTLYGLKNVGNTFGPGLPPEIAGGLRGEDGAERLTAIRHLLERWVEAYLASKALDAEARIAWRNRIQAAREEGDRLLRQYRESGNAAMTAPAFAEAGECAICTGASEGASRAAGAALPPFSTRLRRANVRPPAAATTP